MNNWISIAGLVISGLTLIGLVMLAIFVLRLPQKQAAEKEFNLSQIAENQHRLAQVIKPLVATGPPLDCVITRLSFHESFDHEQFAQISQQCALNHVNSVLARSASNGVVLAINAIRLKQSTVEVVVAVSKKNRSLLENGTLEFARDSSGQRMGLIRDHQSKQFVEQLKEGRGAKELSRLAAASAVIIGAAHLISGADIAKRLNVIDKKIDLLLAYRQIDKLARLERIYTEAKELCIGPMNRDKLWAFWRLRGELRELRCGWRRELQHHLHLIDDPKSAPWLAKMFAWLATNDSAIYGQISESQLQLAMIEYSMRLELTLAAASGTVTAFESTLAGELVELQEVADLLKSKASLISKDFKLSVEPTLIAMNSIVKEYRELLPSSDNAALPSVHSTDE